jgi:hypothetical protein
MFPRIAAVFGLIVLSSTPALAAPTIYNCALDVAQTQGWVASQIVIAHDVAAGTVVVNDGIIDHFVGKPVAGKVSVENAKRITFNWELPQVKNSANQVAPRFVYRATFIKATGLVSVVAKPLNYGNDFSARGTCAVK